MNIWFGIYSFLDACGYIVMTFVVEKLTMKKGFEEKSLLISKKLYKTVVTESYNQ